MEGWNPELKKYIIKCKCGNLMERDRRPQGNEKCFECKTERKNGARIKQQDAGRKQQHNKN